MLGRAPAARRRGLCKAISSVAIVAIVASGCSAPTARPFAADRTLVDLSHDYSDQTVFWPTADAFKLEKVADGEISEERYISYRTILDDLGNHQRR